MDTELGISESTLERLPPQSLDAEQALLGSLLVSADGMSRVVDLLEPDYFYRKAHQVIYAAALDLFDKNEPIDIITVSQFLKDENQLEQIGGRQYITDLALSVATTANLEYYAKVVQEKALLRHLIKAGTEIVSSCYEETDAEVAIDRAEHLIFGLAQRRNMQQLVHIKNIVESSFEKIEQRYENRDQLSGVPSGFYDLDALTAGFQPSDLVIVAARPSMGKCLSFDSEIVLADGSISTIQDIYKTRTAKLLTLDADLKLRWVAPSAFVDDGIKPVFKVTTRLGRSVETTLSHPFLTIGGWKKLEDIRVGSKVAVPRRIPAFGTNRLRECEVKLLAYLIGDDKIIPPVVFTLTVKQVALFLNRLFATDGWATVLTSGQAQLGYCSVNEKLCHQIQHLLLRFGIISKLRKRSVKYQDSSRIAFQLDITDKESIETFISEIGIFGKEAAVERVRAAIESKRLQTNCDLIPLEIWSEIQLAKGNESWSSLARRCDVKNYSNLHVAKRSLSRPRLLQLATGLKGNRFFELATSDIYWDEVTSIEPMGLKQVYDLTIPDTHNFVANDVCVHNTAFVLNIAQHVAVEHNTPVAVFSLEMSKEQLVSRMLCSEANIDANRLRTGHMHTNDWTHLAVAMGRLGEAPIYIDDSALVSVLDIRAKCRRLKAEQKGLGLVIIDYIQLMQGRKATDNRVQEVSEISRGLKTLAREIGVPVIALSQLSRAVETRQNKRPMLSDLRESGSIEQDADIVMFIYRDEYYNPETDRRGEAEIIIAKQRNGPVGTAELLYQSSITRFLNKVHNQYTTA
jgi:replicative DNA helicase